MTTIVKSRLIFTSLKSWIIPRRGILDVNFSVMYRYNELTLTKNGDPLKTVTKLCPNEQCQSHPLLQGEHKSLIFGLHDVL